MVSKKKLIKLFKVLSWLDNKRWNQVEEYQFFSKRYWEEVILAKDLSATEKILINWLVTITNRIKVAEGLLEKNFPILRDLVVDYRECREGGEDKVSKICFQHLYRRAGKDEPNHTIQALPADVRSIWRTLIILLDYKNDIIKFLTERMGDWKEEELCSRLAFRLYLLSFKGIGTLKTKAVKELLNRRPGEENIKMKEAKAILKDGGKFEEEYNRWNESNQRWHKRIWLALRDYLKPEMLRRVFIQGIADKGNQKIWRDCRDKLTQLEVPGDMWNEEFFKRVIKPIAGNVKGRPAKIVRELWEKIKDGCPESYPEQFDVSYDFTSRMCRKNLCEVCPLGKKGAKSICYPNAGFCTVALFTCGYLVDCDEKDCIIKDNIGQGVCRGNYRE